MICEKCHHPTPPFTSIDTLGKRLQLLRHQNRLTIDDISRFNDISVSHLSLIENGKRKPSLSTITKLVQYYSVTFDYLLEGL